MFLMAGIYPGNAAGCERRSGGLETVRTVENVRLSWNGEVTVSEKDRVTQGNSGDANEISR